MLLRELVHVIGSEHDALKHLQAHSLLLPDYVRCQKCNSSMREELVANRSRLRCNDRACNANVSIRVSNRFFFYKSSDCRAVCKLTLAHIIELVQVFLYYQKCTISEAERLTAHGTDLGRREG